MIKKKQKPEPSLIGQQAQYIGSIVADIMDAHFIPGGSTVSVAIQQVFKKRLDAAREILLQEIADGQIDMSDAGELEEIAAIIYRYGRAAQEGAAKANLRLLAQVIAGKNSSITLTADRFLYYADVISSLKVDEIKLLGIMVREKATTASQASEALKKLFSEQESEKIFQSLLRTGLIIFYQDISVEDETDWKAGRKYNSKLHTDYHLTSLMDDICKYVSFDVD
jgi:hypothetical protein